MEAHGSMLLSQRALPAATEIPSVSPTPNWQRGSALWVWFARWGSGGQLPATPGSPVGGETPLHYTSDHGWVPGTLTEGALGWGQLLCLSRHLLSTCPRLPASWPPRAGAALRPELAPEA